MYTSQYYTNPEIDERLLQGYYDDAVAAGFTGSKADFHQAIIKARALSDGVSDIDSLHSVTDLGTYLYIGNGWKGLVNVNFDAQSNVSQVALSSSTPSYENDSLIWISAKPCVMVRTYTNGAWSVWSKAGADVVNDLVTGGTDKALSAEQGKILNEAFGDLAQKIGKVKIPITESGKYITTNTGVGNVVGSVATSSTGLSYSAYSVTWGDKVIVNGAGGSAGRLWAFVDSNDIILSVADSSVSATNLELIAPTDAAKVYINTNSDENYYISKNALSTKIALKADVDDDDSFDFSIKDESGFRIISLINGQILTKNFNSTGVNEKLNSVEHGAQVNDVITEETGNGDLVIRDGNGKAILILRNGHIITKFFNSSEINNKVDTDSVVLTQDEICDYFAIGSNGTKSLSAGFGCSHYIDCFGSKSMRIAMPVTTSASGYGLIFYNEGKYTLSGSFIECPTDSEEGMEIVEVTIPTNAHYFRTTYWDKDNSDIYGNFSCEISYPKGFLGNGKYRPYQSGNIYFSVEVEQSVEDWQSTSQTLGRTLDKKKTTGVLLLPTSYSQTGKKTPLIMYCHGKSHGVYYGTWGSTATFQTQKEHFIARGYAVFDCNGAKDTNRQAEGANAFVSAPQNVEAYYKAYKYIVEHYNVEDKICVLGGSMGGPVAVQFSLTRGNCVKALGLLAAYVQLKTLWAGTAGSVFRPYFGVAAGDNQGWDDNIEKIRPHAPECRMFEVNNVIYFNGMECPVHAWIGANDASITVPGTLSMHEQLRGFIAALRNSGKVAYIREPQGLAHEIVSGAIQSIDDEVCDWFDMFNKVN